MISAWWLLVAFFAGGMFGVMVAGLCAAGRNGSDE